MARILIVEDNELVRRAVRLILELAEHEVGESADGESGLAALARERFDVVLADLSMPGMGGLAFVGAVKTQFSGLPVVVMSGGGVGSDGGDLLEAARGAGADLVLRKPFDDRALLEALASLPPRAS
jgi:CheY-like chemotaxis protein